MWKRSVISLVVPLTLLLALAPAATAQILNTNNANNAGVAAALAGVRVRIDCYFSLHCGHSLICCAASGPCR